MMAMIQTVFDALSSALDQVMSGLSRADALELEDRVSRAAHYYERTGDRMPLDCVTRPHPALTAQVGAVLRDLACA